MLHFVAVLELSFGQHHFFRHACSARLSSLPTLLRSLSFSFGSVTFLRFLFFYCFLLSVLLTHTFCSFLAHCRSLMQKGSRRLSFAPTVYSPARILLKKYGGHVLYAMYLPMPTIAFFLLFSCFRFLYHPSVSEPLFSLVFRSQFQTLHLFFLCFSLTILHVSLPRLFVSPVRLLHSHSAYLHFLCASLMHLFFLPLSAPALPAQNAVQNASSSAGSPSIRKRCFVHPPDACLGHFHFLRLSPPAAFLLPYFSPVFLFFLSIVILQNNASLRFGRA